METPQPFDRLAYLGRVSTPKQKLEHQRESVLRFCEARGLHIPPERMFEDKVRRHRAATDGEGMKRLMALVESRQIDWIIIATFDRWGIEDENDIFILRKKLRQYDVQLWSVADELNVTGIDDSAFIRVATNALAATRYVSQMADKNIQKMITMAQQGWATTGNNPFGLDLVLYPLDMSRPLLRVVRLRYKPHLYRIIHYKADSSVEKEEVSERMPLRDKKATGYRLAPSVEAARLKAVNLMFEMFDDGLGFATISDRLWDMGYQHYDRPFGYHGVETILSNSAYLGLPAWGKIGCGRYRRCIDKQPHKITRKSTDTVTLKKTEDQFIYAVRPVFEPVVDPALFNRVKAKLQQRAHVNPSFGKRRTRDRATHPLNGKLCCPDCSTPDKPVPMVLGSFMPTKGKRYRCFHCGTWRKTIRRKCHANTVRWALLDEATDRLLTTVRGRIDRLLACDPSTLQNEEWLMHTEFGRIMGQIFDAVLDATRLPNDWTPDLPKTTAFNNYIDILLRQARQHREKALEKISEMERVAEELVGTEEGEKVRAHARILRHRIEQELERDTLSATDDDETANLIGWACAEYNERFAAQTEVLRVELEEVEAELKHIADDIINNRVPSATVRSHLNVRMGQLEERKAEITQQLVPLTAKASALIEQLNAIKNTIEKADTAKRAELLDAFLEAVYPIFDVKIGKDNRRRAYVVGFRFVPRETAEKVLPEPMEVGSDRTGRGSSPPPARSGPGRSSRSGRGRSSPAPAPAAGAAPPGCGGGIRVVHPGKALSCQRIAGG